MKIQLPAQSISHKDQFVMVVQGNGTAEPTFTFFDKP
jgi:hypothetical protein